MTRMSHELRWTRSDWLGLGLLLIVASLIYLPVIQHQICCSIHGDYGVHLDEARNFVETGTTERPIPTFLFYQSVALLVWLLPINYDTAGLVVTLGHVVLTAALIFVLLRHQVAARLVAMAVTLILMLIMPMNLSSPFDWNALYFGYIPVTPYHNTTLTVLKLYALALGWLVALIFQGRQSRNMLWLVAIVTLLSIAAKPNYVIALLPASGLYALYLLLRGQRQLDWRMLIVFWSAAVIGLGLGFVQTFLNPSGVLSGGIALDPFAFIARYEPISRWLLVKLLLSVLFPLLVYLLHWHAAWRDHRLNMAWLTFFSGAAAFYLLVETGFRAGDGNFFWGAMAASFVLFVASAQFWLMQSAPLRRGQLLRIGWRDGLCLAAGILHFVSGIVWWRLNLIF